MSQSGNLVFYSTSQFQDPEARLAAILALSGASTFDSATRTIGPNNTWERYKSNPDDAFPPEETVGQGMTLAALPSLYREGTCLDIALGPCPVGRDVHLSIRDNIDPAIRGDFCPSQVIIAVGYHDLFEFAEHEDGFLFARAFLSFMFWGYSTPLDWEAFREEVFRLPEMLRVRHDLQSIVGNLTECGFWNV